METIRPAILDADMMVFITPLYYSIWGLYKPLTALSFSYHKYNIKFPQLQTGEIHQA